VRQPQPVTAQGVRHISPPPPSDAAASLEELTAYRVREKLHGELRQDRTELFNKIDSAVKSLDDKLGSKFDAVSTKFDAVSTKFDAVNTKIDAVNTKLDGAKSDISLQAGAVALGGATLAVSALGFFFEKKVAMVDTKPALSSNIGK
jgi:hypothetical protein